MIGDLLGRSSMALFLLLLSAGCAGSGSKKNGQAVQSYYKQIGITYRNEFIGVLQIILLNKHQFHLSRSEESQREIYFETAWKDRPVLADEVTMGIAAARIRFIVKAKARHAGQYKVHFYADNRVRYENKDEMEPGPISKLLRKYIDQVANELKTEFRLLY